MNKTKIFADYNNVTGKIKPMHCGNGGPRCGGEKLRFDFSDEFRYMGIPYSRLHDIEYPYGSNQFVDIHCIFPDFDADENDPQSYNFKPTDDYLKGIIDAGSKVFYRLGESIDHYPKQLYVRPPKSIEKWAKICEHIIMHYNEGWADGFNYGIKYWEIWNEPDNPKMWTGTQKDFFELYRVTSNHLKTRFGDSIKVGGCAFSGFYALNRPNPKEWYKSLIPYLNEFLSYITDEKTFAPLDFFSWHCYADSPEEVALHAGYAREFLKKYNIINCESILNEFNLYYVFGQYAPLKKGNFTDIAASMILAQKSDMDMMMYYMFESNSRYNSSYAISGIKSDTTLHFAGIEAFADFNYMYSLGSQVKTSDDIEGKLNVLGAKSDDEGALMIVSRDFEGEVSVEILGEYTSFDVKRTNDKNADGAPNVIMDYNLPLKNGKIDFVIEKSEILLITLKK